MSIPIKNIYFLLCYAWDKLDEKEQANIAVEDIKTVVDLLTSVLISASHRLLKRGIDQSYIHHTDEIAGIKGKLLISETIKRNLSIKSKSFCEFDSFSPDIVTNRILVTTIRVLIKVTNLSNSLRMKLVNLLRKFPVVTPIKITQRLFKTIRLNRNNHYYGFALDVCHIIYNNIQPSEEAGNYQFIDFSKDERKMARLFEAFVRNFYRHEQTQFCVKRERLTWQLEGSLDDKKYLPKMETDITLVSETTKIIIDTKYYNETLSKRWNTEKIKSTNLYQLYSYLLNQRNPDDKASLSTTGILLYPTIDYDYSLDFYFEQHAIKIRTVDLNAHWQDITDRLQTIII